MFHFSPSHSLKLLFLLLLALPGAVFGQCTTVPNLSFQNPVKGQGGSSAINTAYRFKNVLGDVDAVVTIIGKSNASLVTIDLATEGSAHAWQPQVAINGQGRWGSEAHMDFRVDFVATGTDSLIAISSMIISAIDIDGDGYRLREGVGFHNVNLFMMDSPSELYSWESSEGFTMFAASTVANQAGISTTATRHMASITLLNSSSFEIRCKVIADPSPNGASNAHERMFSMAFDPCIPNNYDTPITFPVELSDFFGVAGESNVTLGWITASELNNDHFEVQKSADGKVFYAAGTLSGQGTTNAATSYEFVDLSPVVGSNYYRLKQVDVNGEYTYSNLVEVEMASLPSRVELWPNPTNSECNIRLLGGEVITRLTMYSASGLEVPVTISEQSDTEVKVSFDEHLSRGLYFITIYSNNKWLPAQRVVIQ